MSLQSSIRFVGAIPDVHLNDWVEGTRTEHFAVVRKHDWSDGFAKVIGYYLLHDDTVLQRAERVWILHQLCRCIFFCRILPQRACAHRDAYDDGFTYHDRDHVWDSGWAILNNYIISYESDRLTELTMTIKLQWVRGRPNCAHIWYRLSWPDTPHPPLLCDPFSS